MYDAIVVGGGPAGLSAALQLGRARRRTLLLDAGTPRNHASTHVNGLIAVDGTSPTAFRSAARSNLERYAEVTVRRGWAESLRPSDDGFELTVDDEVLRARRVLLATGIVDVLPDLPQVEQFWGISVVQCPFCHGWELADGPLCFLATTPEELDAAHLFRVWSPELTVLTGGEYDVPEQTARLFERDGVGLHTSPVADLCGTDGRLSEIRLADDTVIKCQGLFVHNEQRQTQLVRDLDLELDEDGFVVVRKDYHLPDPAVPLFETSMPGLYAAGDLTGESQDAVLATFEGTMAGRKIFFDSLGD